MEKKNFVLIAIIILLLFIILSGIILYIFVLNKQVETGKKEIEIDESIVMYGFGSSFITNVKDSKKMVKLTVKLEADESLVELLDYKKSAIIDKINLILRAKTEADLSGVEGQMSLKSEIKSAVINILSTDKYLEVNVEEFLVQ